MSSIHNSATHEKMLPVSSVRPCPICKKHDWCLVAADGKAAICQRVESAKRCGEAGWLHHLGKGDTASTDTKHQSARSTTDWAAKAQAFAANLTGQRKQLLAKHLKLQVNALDAIPHLGFQPDSKTGGWWTFPEMDSAGRVVGILRRYRPGTGPGGKDKLCMKGGRRGLTLLVGWRDRPGPVLVVEGPTCAAAAFFAGLSAVGRPSNESGVEQLTDLLRDFPVDRDIVIVGENDQKPNGDWPGRRGAESVARRLAEALRRPIRWTIPPNGSKDCRDWLTADTHRETPWPARGQKLLEYLTSTRTTVEPPADAGNVPEIVIGTDEHRVNDEAIAALGGQPDLFQRGGMLVLVCESSSEPNTMAAVRRPDPMPVVRDVPNPLLRDILTRCARWRALRNNAIVPTHPPDWCVSAVGARKVWPSIRVLKSVVTHPALLPDGSLLTVNGYDPASRLLISLPQDLAISVPDRPTREDVASAVAVLLDVVHDFPFETPAHRSAWFASLLTPLAWFAFNGPAPLFLIDGNVRGVGKGLLADVVSLIVTGGRFPVMSYTNDKEELRKKITTLAVEGERLVLLDNLTGVVDNPVLDMALTSDTWKDRLLGGNQIYNGPLNVTWFATGNNVQLAADTARRVCHVRMESLDERPEVKEGFRYRDLRQHVFSSRGTLLTAALTILRGWVVAGRPTHNLPPWGSFEQWSSVVREAIVFAGLPDPGETRLLLQTMADRDANAMADILTGLAEMDPSRQGMTTAEIVKRLKDGESPTEAMANMLAAVEELCGKLCGRLLGYKFRHFARRNFNGRMIDKAGATRGVNRWVVVPAKAGRGPNHPDHPHHHSPETDSDGGDGGDGGDDSPRPGHNQPYRRGTPLEMFPEQRLPDSRPLS